MRRSWPVRRPVRRRGPTTARRLVRGLRNLGFGLALLLALGQALDYAAGFRPRTAGCRVVQVIDGDTLRLTCPEEGGFTARLTGFDSPELFSPGCPAEAAKALLATQRLRWIVGSAGEIEVRLLGADRYGRRLAELWVDGRSVAARMVDAGLARPYTGGRRGDWCA